MCKSENWWIPATKSLEWISLLSPPLTKSSRNTQKFTRQKGRRQKRRSKTKSQRWGIFCPSPFPPAAKSNCAPPPLLGNTEEWQLRKKEVNKIGKSVLRGEGGQIKGHTSIRQREICPKKQKASFLPSNKSRKKSKKKKCHLAKGEERVVIKNKCRSSVQNVDLSKNEDWHLLLLLSRISFPF